MTPSKEDYLKIIFELGGVDKRIPNKLLSLSLSVAPPSVTEMVTRLQKEGVLDYVPYHGVSLTAEGVEIAQELLRQHRIWETFLRSHLKFSRFEIHDYAELLEHASDSRLADRLWAYLDYPEYSPDGGKIPQMEIELIEDTYKTISEFEMGEVIRISRFLHDDQLFHYLETHMVDIGDPYRIDSLVNETLTLTHYETGKKLMMPHTYAVKIFALPLNPEEDL